jgi:hypothetical protein
MLRPAGQGFARVAVASTLCPGCARRLEHPIRYTVDAVQTRTDVGIRTRLIANHTLLIHACTNARDPHATEVDAG